MLDLFTFETSQNIEQLEQIILENEKASQFSSEAINEIFRIMHTIKGSAAMMMFGNISTVAHKAEDLFDFIRNHTEDNIDYSGLPDLVLESLDFIGSELEKIKAGALADGDGSNITVKVSEYLTYIKEKYEHIPEAEGGQNQKPTQEEIPKAQTMADNPTISDVFGNTYKAKVFFEEGCQMESLRAFDIINRLSSFATVISYAPDDIMDNDNSASIIREKGFEVIFKSDRDYEKVNGFFAETIFLRSVEVEVMDATDIKENVIDIKNGGTNEEVKVAETIKNQAPLQDTHNAAVATIINVNVAKLDKLMDLVGEMVISEAMVIENPDIKGLELDNFNKASRQLHKITMELQDIVMSVRMVPLADVFNKMHRIVRDMSKKLDKEVKLEIIGEETEADKNIITHLSDPLMHLVRNSIDHGLETVDERIKSHKPKAGTITLEARNAGNDVLVIVRDDGLGLNKAKILEKAKKNGLLKKDLSEMTDKEIYNLILVPGFSTNDKITEYSGRGVGMDVVTQNISEVGGSVTIDSAEGVGTTITIKIPLTLAIIDGMNVRVGECTYTIPTISIKESFRPKKEDLVNDLDGNEMIMVRGQCYAITRLHQRFNVATEVTDFEKGIFIMVEQYEKAVCIFADDLIGQQQVVVKVLPNYIKNTHNVHGLAGCTLLGDGSISLILDVGWFVGLKE